MKPDEIKSLVGQHVYLVNDAAVNWMDNKKVQIRLTGRLEMTQEPGEEPEFYLRVKEDSNGPSGVNFRQSHVLEVYKQTGAFEICLK